MIGVWLGLSAAVALLVFLAFLPCPGCDARRARIKAVLDDWRDKKLS